MTPLRLFDARREPLAGLALFDGAALEAIEAVLGRSRVLATEPGERVLAADSANACLYVVLSGTLRVELAPRDAANAAHLGRGECVGELSVIDGARTSAAVRAVDRCELLALEGRDVLVLAEASHAVARNLLRILSRRLRGADELLREQAVQSEALRVRSLTDALTGLYTRAWLDERLHRLAQRSDHGAPQFSLIMADVDHFKEFNDRWGHLAGDRVLQLVGETLRAALRPGDAAARYGGEEFVVVLPAVAELEQARRVAERIRDALGAAALLPGGDPDSPRLTMSLGVALRHPHEDVRALLQRADEAMYRAKRAGRNRVAL